MADTKRKKRRKQRVYLVSSSREKGCGILNGALFASRHRDNQIHPIEIEKGMLGKEARKSRDGVT